jgi:TonB family protein
MKSLFLIAVMLVASASFAQQTNVYLKANGQKTTIKDSAIFVRTTTGPDALTGTYTFKEAFITGEPLREGKISKPELMAADGDYTVFYPSGKPLIRVVQDNWKLKSETTYYANGIVYLALDYVYETPDPSKPKDVKRQVLITTCNDSTGKALVRNGNGTFVSYTPVIDEHFKKFASASAVYKPAFNDLKEQGGVKNGLYDGEWTGKSTTSKMSYAEQFKDGKFISGKSLDQDGKAYQYNDAVEKSAEYPGGIEAFYSFLGRKIRYPAKARENNVQGKVFATFVVNKDGSLGELKILRAPSPEMGEETFRVLSQSPTWIPGRQHGIPVRQQYTVPVSFSLANK